MKILILNAGSSSQKSCLYDLSDTDRSTPGLPDIPPDPLWEAQLDWSRQPGMASLTIHASGKDVQQTFASESRRADTLHLLKSLWDGPAAVLQQPSQIDIVGHRVVHGGADYQASTRITPEVKGAIARLAALAPAHNPANLQGIEVAETLLGIQIPQLAVFDTAFHAHMPLSAALYPGPYSWFEQGIRRYGFHGISHRYCAHRAAKLLGRDLQQLRLIICHLGNGCSLSAVRHGHSIDTTMGFTPLDGLMMGTRSGAVDPGILIHLLRQDAWDTDRLDQVLNHESGLKGISGLSGDMRQITEAIAHNHPRATLAFDLFIHRLRSGIGAMLASLGGLDALVFTAGIGEHSAPVRASACEAFGFLGLQIDAEANKNQPVDQDIATASSTARVLVMHTQEDWAIAQDCWGYLTDVK